MKKKFDFKRLANVPDDIVFQLLLSNKTKNSNILGKFDEIAKIQPINLSDEFDVCAMYKNEAKELLLKEIKLNKYTSRTNQIQFMVNSFFLFTLETTLSPVHRDNKSICATFEPNLSKKSKFKGKLYGVMHRYFYDGPEYKYIASLTISKDYIDENTVLDDNVDILTQIIVYLKDEYSTAYLGVLFHSLIDKGIARKPLYMKSVNEDEFNQELLKLIVSLYETGTTNGLELEDNKEDDKKLDDHQYIDRITKGAKPMVILYQ